MEGWWWGPIRGNCWGRVRKRRLMPLRRDILCEKTRGRLKAPLPVTNDLPLLP